MMELFQLVDWTTKISMSSLSMFLGPKGFLHLTDFEKNVTPLAIAMIQRRMEYFLVIDLKIATSYLTWSRTLVTMELIQKTDWTTKTSMSTLSGILRKTGLRHSIDSFVIPKTSI
jgi:hypothetical protein